MAVPRPESPNKGGDVGVQERLLNAAEVLFCDRGFEATGVRDIATAANCNVAAVNYYFGGKESLYVEVWRRVLGAMREARLASIERVMRSDRQPTLEELLGSYARSFVEPLVGEGSSRRFITMMAREMVDPHLPPDMFAAEMIGPVMAALSEALIQLCPGLEQSKAQLAILSVVGQLVHTSCAVGMLEHSGHAGLPKPNIEQMLDHIVQFSAAGIRACAEAKSQ